MFIGTESISTCISFNGVRSFSKVVVRESIAVRQLVAGRSAGHVKS
jgi:hypothetical protein